MFTYLIYTGLTLVGLFALFVLALCVATRTLAPIRWWVLAIGDLIVSFIAVVFSWFLALFGREAMSNKWCYVKGPREYLPGWLHLFSTQDDGVDAGWYKGLYDDRMNKSMAEKARAGSSFAKWYLRMMWIVRNNAYGFGHYIFGYDRAGSYTTKDIIKKGEWDTTTTNVHLRVDTNTKGQKAFQLRMQLYFKGLRYVRVQVGWKLNWKEDRVQIAVHINPFRKWKTA